MEKKDEENPHVRIWEQINGLYAKLAQLTADISEVKMLMTDISDGMYRRKVRKPREEEKSDYDQIMELMDAIKGGAPFKATKEEGIP